VRHGWLISNTIKYNEADTKIQISVKEIDNNIRIIIIIKDDGIGIDKKEAAEIFNRFVKGNRLPNQWSRFGTYN
jgi:signal transduction histidine kinase